MKKLGIEEILNELDDLGMGINPDFFNKEQIEVPILKQVGLLLDAVGEKGLKLTARGNLPTKVVKEITLCCPEKSDEAILEFTNRYLEDEQVSAQRARVVAEVGELLKVSKGKIEYGSKAEAYIHAAQAEKYIYLLWQFGRVNLAYFDRMQESALVNGISFLLLQVLRDKPKMFREVKVYSAFLLDSFPGLGDEIEKEIEEVSLFRRDPFEIFEDMMELRLFKNFFIPFGLAKERGFYWEENYKCAKTGLLEALLLPQDEVDTSMLLNKKELRSFAQRIKKEKLDIDLFHDFCFIYAHAARYPLKPVQVIVEDLVKAKRLIGTAAKAQGLFYTDLAKATEQTLKYFTQLEVKGGGSRGDGMKDDFLSLVDGLYAILPSDRPHNMVVAMQAIPLFFLDMLQSVYKIDITSKDFYAECNNYFEEETIEDIGAVIFTMSELEKRAKKFKRINANMESMVKEAIMAFILAVMSIYTEEMDRQ